MAPQDRFLVREWARCLYRQGKWQEAEKALLPALESWPTDLEVYSIYFTTLERLGRLDEGIAKFREWAVESPSTQRRKFV